MLKEDLDWIKHCTPVRKNGKKSVVKWVFLWGCYASGPELVVFTTRCDARNARKVYNSFSEPCGPITRIEVPL
jgi:hypothetical protein